MEPKKSEKVFAKKEILQPQGDFQVKLNLVQTNMNARKDEDGYYFVDRNGQAFGVILDFFRTSRLIHSPTSTISLKSILLEANYYSIDLSFAFCGNLIEGVYVSESVNGAEIIYIERDKRIPWNFGVTGAIYGEKEKKTTWIDFWQEVFVFREGEIESDEFCISCSDLNGDSFYDGYIEFRQKNLFNSVKKLHLVSQKMKCKEDIASFNLFSDTWWVGNIFVTEKRDSPVKVSFCLINEEDSQKWIASIDCGHEKIIGPFDVTILSKNFFLVSTAVCGFWMFLQKPDRILSFKPIIDEDGFDRCYIRYDGSMRFIHL